MTSHRIKQSFEDFCFGLWSSLNLGLAAIIGLVVYAVLVQHYDDMHAISTARDPDPHVARAMVVHNVALQSASTGVGLLLGVALFWVFNYLAYAHQSRYRKIGFWIAWGCSLLLMFGLCAANYYCLNTYPK